MLVRVYNQIKNLECYVPAIVEFLPEDHRNSQKFYSVLMFNGQRVFNLLCRHQEKHVPEMYTPLNPTFI